jgi:hypothetical protein
VRSLNELLGLVREAGLEPVAWYGGLDGSTLELASRRLVLVGAAPGGPSRGDARGHADSERVA